jgi:ribose 5-phosphate isomerase A
MQVWHKAENWPTVLPEFRQCGGAPADRCHLIAAGFTPGMGPSGVCAGAGANRAKVEGVSTEIDEEKRSSALAAAALVESGMFLGLGTGTTVAFLVPALGDRHLDVTSVATSPATQSAARAAGLKVVPFEGIDRLDLAIDGSDQVDPQGWLIKGGGGAHTREKIVAAAADRFVVIVSSNKVVDRLRPPVPLELMAFGLDVVRRVIPGIELRRAPLSPDGGVLADYHGEVDDPERLSALFDATPGVVAHGLFPPTMVSAVLIGRGDQVEERRITL